MKEAGGGSSFSVGSLVLGMVPWAVGAFVNLGPEAAARFVEDELLMPSWAAAPVAVLAGIIALVLRQGRRGLAIAGMVLGLVFIGFIGVVWFIAMLYP